MKSLNLRRSIGIRLAIIANISLVLLIPAVMIQFLISESQDRRNEANVFNQKYRLVLNI